MKKQKAKKNLFKRGKEEKACSNSGTGSFYFLGFIGASIYYLQQAPSFWQGVLGILKAAIWPVFLVHKLLGL